MKKGKFIIIEGVDGCGGQTQTNLLKEYLGRKETLFLSFPQYETDLGKIIDKFLHKKIVYEEKAVELLVFYADILQFKPVILEALESGKNVICDRYFTSTITFQTLQGKSLKDVLALNEIFKLPSPDICFLLDITGEESQKRKAKEKQGFENLDRNEKDLIFMNKVRWQYLKMAKEQVFCTWEIINGQEPIKKVFNNIIKKI